MAVGNKCDIVMTTEPDAALAVVRQLLQGTYISRIQFCAGFSVDFSRSSRPEKSLLPMTVRLSLKSYWWVGERREWDELLKNPIRPIRSGEPYEPLQAYFLMLLNSSMIADVRLDCGELVISTDEGTDLHVEMTDAVFEESWILDVAQDVPHHEYWSVVCDSKGALYARRPKQSSINQDRDTSLELGKTSGTRV